MSTTIKRVREIMRQADRVAPDAYEDAWNDPVGQQTLARIREGAVVESGTTTDWTDPHPLRLPSRRHRNSRLGQLGVVIAVVAVLVATLVYAQSHRPSGISGEPPATTPFRPGPSGSNLQLPGYHVPSAHPSTTISPIPCPNGAPCPPTVNPTPSHLPASAYGSLPRTVLDSTVLDSPVCRNSRASYGMAVAATKPGDTIFTSAVPSGAAAINASVKTAASYVLTTATRLRAYPARLTDPPQIKDVVVWVVEYTGLELSGPGGPARPSAEAPQPEVFETQAADFIDADTGKSVLMQFCS